MNTSKNQACNASDDGGYKPTHARNQKRSCESFDFTSHEQDPAKRIEPYSETHSSAMHMSERECEALRNLIRAELQKSYVGNQIPPQT